MKNTQQFCESIYHKYELALETRREKQRVRFMIVARQVFIFYAAKGVPNMNTKPLYNTELSNPPAALIRLTDIWENDMVPNQSPGRKRSPGRNAKVRQCIDIPLAMELRGASQYATQWRKQHAADQ